MGSFAILVGILHYFYFIATVVFKFIIFLFGIYSSLKLPHKVFFMKKELQIIFRFNSSTAWVRCYS